MVAMDRPMRMLVYQAVVRRIMDSAMKGVSFPLLCAARDVMEVVEVAMVRTDLLDETGSNQLGDRRFWRSAWAPRT